VSLAVWAAAAACVGAAMLLLARRRSKAPALPLAGARELFGVARRTRALQALLVCGVLAALLAIVVQARDRPGERELLQPGADAVVVVDLSSSTRSAAKRIAGALQGLAHDQRRRLGLVLFSNTAYEALPPSTPADAFAGWVDRFAHAGPRTSPWSAFSSGTTISTGLVLARRILRRDSVRQPRVVLVSDLVDPPSDLQRLETTVAQYQRDGIDLKLVRLLQSSHGAAATPLSVPNAAFVERVASTTVTARPSGSEGGRLLVLAVLLGILAVLATAHELAFHPFSWGAGA
jgi:Mg-chelatase subunit ChlD